MAHGRTLKEFKSTFKPEQEVLFLREENELLRAKLMEERKATGEAREQMFALSQAISAAAPVKMVYQPSKKGDTPVTHVLHLTDLHYGEVIVKDEVDGFGEFSPEIAEQRLHRLGENILRITETKRHGYNIPYLHILGTADYISGDIHEELRVTNAFPCPVQAVRCGYALGALVEMFVPHFERITLDMITLDNHGRITPRYQSAEGGLNNWSYVVAQILAQYVSRLSNVEVRIHAKPSALVEIGSERYLIFHGHQMRGWAGKPYYGFDRRVAMEAVKRMGVPSQAFTKLVFGHFHTATNEKDWQLGGSLSGTNAYDHSCGRHARAHQTSWLVHPKHGEFDWTRWWLD
jgi:hypothetical protein